ncbi:2-oxoglutarate dehydrogenase E1 component [Basfia succiniciproducens]|uniref:oxoglutarate dehydrogenase (succinyl-transferring) n=1 Tax=Basfia succiniciproducens TaxID=653940 RepID=A0A1G5BRS5_9PAST|nr:2-oxoglutarate dehydrogenase E1 component [Basfia succiniciproducens]
MPELDYKHHGFSEADLNETVTVGKYVYGKDTMKFSELAEALKQTYLGTIGLEFMHVQDMEQRNWLQAKMESVLNKPLFTRDEKSIY